MLFDEVKEIILENLSCEEEEVTMEADIANDLAADSLDIVELSMALEDKFGIEIADTELENLKTVGDIVAFIEARQ